MLEYFVGTYIIT